MSKSDTLKKYIDEKDRLIFVRAGIGLDTFKAHYQDAGKWNSAGAHALRTVEWRPTIEDAQADLDAYAAKKGWKLKEPDPTCKECSFYLIDPELDEVGKCSAKLKFVENDKSVAGCKEFKRKEEDEVEVASEMWKCPDCGYYGHQYEERKDVIFCEFTHKDQRKEDCNINCSNFKIQNDFVEGSDCCTTCVSFIKKSKSCEKGGTVGEMPNAGYCSSGYQRKLKARDKNIRKKPEEKQSQICPNYKGSTGPAVTNLPEIRCGTSKTVYGESTLKNFEKQFDICIHSPEKCCISPLYVPKKSSLIEQDPDEQFEDEKLKDTIEKNENACPYGKLSCHAIGLDGNCDVIRRKDWDRYYFIKEMEKYNIDCDIFKKLAEKIIAEKKPEKSEYANETPKIANDKLENDKIANETSETVTNSIESVNEPAPAVFDYSTVDHETATFLQEKATNITQITAISFAATGKELISAQAMLSNKGYGCFGEWCESIGMSRQTAHNYMNVYNLFVKRVGHTEYLEKASARLLYEIAKPSAPAELVEKVVSGDITTHKEYKELEEKLKTTEKKLETERIYSQNNYNAYEKKSDEANKLKKEVERIKADNSKTSQTLQSLQQQLDQAKRNGDPAKIRELGEKISEYQQEIEDLKGQIKEKNEQLNAKPIEVPAVRVVEKIPDEHIVTVTNRLYGILLGAKSITRQEIEICAGASHTKKMPVIEFLENLRDMVPEYLDILNGDVQEHGKCEDCRHVEYDGLKEEDEAAGYVGCTQEGFRKLVLRNKGCDKFETMF